MDNKKSDCLDDYTRRFEKTWFCDELVSGVLKDIIGNPKKYADKCVFFVGEKSPLEYCAISLRSSLNNRGIGYVRIGTSTETSGNGIFFDVDDYLRKKFAAQI